MALLLSELLPRPAQRCHVAVYKGEGAGLRSVHSTVATLRRLLPAGFQVRGLSAAAH